MVQEEEDWIIYEQKVLEEIEEEVRYCNPIRQWIKGVQFDSYSRGRNKKPRKHPRLVILLQVNGDSKRGRWRFWNGGDENQKSLRWDEVATEVLGATFCARLTCEGIHADDHLRDEVLKLLRKNKGSF